jgi:NAD(P)-dependent dehydrogenase (short-subunit alcohol dehydrogenase family)
MRPTMDELLGKVIFIAGGGRGIGRATALYAAARGAHVVVADNGAAPDGSGRDEGVAAQAAAEILAEGGQALGINVDVRDRDAFAAAVAQARAAFGALHAGFYCAGLSLEKALVRTSDRELEDLLDLHVRSAFRFVRELGRTLVDQRHGGSLLVCAGVEGLFGAAHRSAMAAASGAIIGFVRSSALELRRHGVRVNCLVPTARTRLTEELPLFASIRADSLTAEQVAPVATYLLSDASQGVLGETIGVAGDRIYALRSSETPGVYLDGPPATLARIAESFPQATRSA